MRDEAHWGKNQCSLPWLPKFLPLRWGQSYLPHPSHWGSAAHNVPRNVVEKQIEDSISSAYNEVVASNQNNQEQQNQSDYYSTIKTNGKQALGTLQEVYSNIKTATLEQKAEFRNLYNSLSSISKARPNNSAEEQQILAQLNDVTNRINALNNSITDVSGITR